MSRFEEVCRLSLLMLATIMLYTALLFFAKEFSLISGNDCHEER